jgi:hypothetical protein
MRINTLSTDASVQGRNWFFVVVDGQEYAESLAYDATKDEVFGMLRLLKEAKAIIEHLLKQQW